MTDSQRTLGGNTMSVEPAGPDATCGKVPEGEDSICGFTAAIVMYREETAPDGTEFVSAVAACRIHARDEWLKQAGIENE